METNVIDILLIEDNPNDAELTLRALKKNNVANKVHLITDGAEALEFFFAKGKYADLAVLNADPFQVKAEELKDIRVDMTVLAGNVASGKVS